MLYQLVEEAFRLRVGQPLQEHLVQGGEVSGALPTGAEDRRTTLGCLTLGPRTRPEVRNSV
jgi:hypothetical protein